MDNGVNEVVSRWAIGVRCWQVKSCDECSLAGGVIAWRCRGGGAMRWCLGGVAVGYCSGLLRTGQVGVVVGIGHPPRGGVPPGGISDPP